MVKRGKPEAALSLGVFASLIGGTFSAIVLATIAPQLSKVTLKFGHWAVSYTHLTLPTTERV